MAPSRAKAKADARPMPLEAPVTMATLPSSSPFMSCRRLSVIGYRLSVGESVILTLSAAKGKDLKVHHLRILRSFGVYAPQDDAASL